MKYFPPGPARPQLITIMAILAGLFGIFGVIASICAISGGIFGGAILGGLGATGAAVQFGFGVVLLSLLQLVFSVLEVAFAYGAWYLKPWAWTLGVGAEGLAIVHSLFNLLFNGGNFFGFLISVAIAGAILYYLFTPTVRQAFSHA